MKKVLSTIALLLATLSLLAQHGLIKGKIIAEANHNPIPDLELELMEMKVLKFTDANGEFSFASIPYGTYTLQIGDGIRASEIIQINVNAATIDIGDIKIAIQENRTPESYDPMASIGLEDQAIDADDDGMSMNAYSPILTASRDPFLSAAAYTFGSMRYILRGYNRAENEVYINGIMMNDVESGAAFWGQWGGLNDVFRNQNSSFALSPLEEGFGGLLGGTSIDATAANQRQQTRITYSNSNRTYNHRVMLTHNTGMMENGWAFSVSGSRRWAKVGYIPGTYYDGYGFFVAASKKLNTKSLLHFTTFGAPTERSKAAPTTQEVMDLAGSNYYNPNWGYMPGGAVRNSKVNRSFQPSAILSYEYNKSVFESLQIAASFQTGYNSNSTLDWYNAQDPRPDYYRKLPSFYLYDPSGVNMDAYDAVTADLTANPDKLQIDWGNIYSANRMNHTSINGMTGNRSNYIIGADRDDVNKYSFTAHYKKAINDKVKIFGGVLYQLQQMESYKEALDLLGGDFWVNQNQFAERTYIGNNILNQNNLLDPDAIVLKGDKYMYHYKSTFQKAYAWGQAIFTYNKIDFFLAGRIGMVGFQREGMYQSGLFPQESLGKSVKNIFLTYAAKAGGTYKINGRNYLYLNGSYVTTAPTFDNTYISPRVRNALIYNPTVETAATIEGGYLLHTPYLNGRISGFTTQFNDKTNIMRFYHEDYRTFINYAMSNIGIRNLGAEIALQAKITPAISVTAVAAWTQVFYTTRPDVSIYRDNDTVTTATTQKVYAKDYYASSGPQSAYTVGLNYRSPKYWWLNVNFNYFDRNYLSINPTRLTEEATDLLDRNSDAFKAIVAQEKLAPFYTIDIFFGKSFMINNYFKSVPRAHLLFINVGVNNITHNTEIVTGGFNQLRFDVATSNPDRFPPKYFYGLGVNYFLNISYKF